MRLAKPRSKCQQQDSISDLVVLYECLANSIRHRQNPAVSPETGVLVGEWLFADVGLVRQMSMNRSNFFVLRAYSQGQGENTKCFVYAHALS